jgi:hypothetical protein
VTLFVSTGLFMVIQMIRGGKVGEDQGHVVTTNDLMGNTDPAMRAISKQKVFYTPENDSNEILTQVIGLTCCDQTGRIHRAEFDIWGLAEKR